jgi:hypothetical protein
MSNPLAIDRLLCCFLSGCGHWGHTVMVVRLGALLDLIIPRDGGGDRIVDSIVIHTYIDSEVHSLNQILFQLKQVSSTAFVDQISDQPGRFLAVFVFGPILIYKGCLYKDWFLIFFGLLLILWDAYWLLTQPPKTRGVVGKKDVDNV